MKIAIGAMMHESNTFAPTRTTLENFRHTQYLTGDDILLAHRGTRSEVGGMLRVFHDAGVEVVPTLSAWAMPAGLVTKAAYLQIRTELIGRLERNRGTLDGLLLALHGAMAVEEIEDPEGDLLEALRTRLPNVPYVAATLDHHANVSDAMVARADFLVGYRTHPHIDQFEVGGAAAKHMIELIKEKPRLTSSFIKLPLMTPAENRTEPIDTLRAEVERIERDQKVLTGSFFVGYPWADVSVQGASALVVTRDDQELADRYATELAAQMWSLRKEFPFPIYSVPQAVNLGQQLADQPIVLNELCDCTLGGSSGDVVSTVRYLLENGIRDSVAVGIVDPESVSVAVQAGVGQAVHLSIGGKVCRTDNPPLPLEATVRLVTANVAGQSSIHAGYETDLGKIVVVETRGIQIILVERAGKIAGPSFLQELGIDPGQQKFIIVKEGLNPLVSYRDVAAKILMVESSGFDKQILRAEDYHKVPRPIYPLDPAVSWSAAGGG